MASDKFAIRPAADWHPRVPKGYPAPAASVAGKRGSLGFEEGALTQPSDGASFTLETIGLDRGCLR